MCYYCQRLTLDHQDHLGRSCFDMWHCENWFARLSVLWMVQHRFSRGLRMVYHLEHLYGFSLSEHINSYSYFLLKSLNITWQEKIFDIIHKKSFTSLHTVHLTEARKQLKEEAYVWQADVLRMSTIDGKLVCGEPFKIYQPTHLQAVCEQEMFWEMSDCSNTDSAFFGA